MIADKPTDCMPRVIGSLYRGCAEIEVLRRVMDEIYEDVQAEEVDSMAVARLINGVGYLLKGLQDRLDSSAELLSDSLVRVVNSKYRGGTV